MAERPTSRRRATVCAERLEDRVLLSTLVLESSLTRPITLDVNPAGGVRTIISGVQTDYAPGQWDGILVSVPSQVAGTPLTVRAAVVPIDAGTTGTFLVTVGDSNGVQDIRAPVSISELPGGISAVRGSITLNDSGDALPRSIVMSAANGFAQIAGLSPAPISLQSLAQVTLVAGTGSGKFDIRGTGTSTSVQLQLNQKAGPYAINIGDGLLSDVLGRVSISGSAAPVALTLDDSQDSADRGWSLRSGPMILFGPPAVGSTNSEPSVPASLSVSASVTAGGTLFSTIDTGVGNNTVAIPFSSGGGSFRLNGAASGDTRLVVANELQVGLANGVVLPSLGPVVSYSNIQSIEVTGGTVAVEDDLGPISLIADKQVKGVSFLAPQHLNSLGLNGGSSVITPGGTNALDVNSLDLSGSAKLDLAGNPLQIHYAAGSDPAAPVRAWLKSGQLFSSVLVPGHALAEADAADGVVSGLAAETLLVRPALIGDANLDGKVDVADLTLLARRYGQGNSVWDTGDFNYDGGVGFDDLVLLARHYGAAEASAGQD